jgi:hypothetical protein
MTDVNNAAETSAAAVAEFNPADQHTWSPEQREHWNTTGDIPARPKKQESEPAAAPAKDGESEVATTETAAESEAASEQGKKERKPGDKLSAREELSKLRAELREAKARLDERERSRAPEPKPASTDAKAEAPKRPNALNWKGTAEEYEAAMDNWESFQRQQAVADFQRNMLQKELDVKLKGQLEEVTAKYPDAKEKIVETWKDFAEVKFPGVIRAMFDDSECLPELMYVLSDEETRSNFIETSIKNPGKAIRALAQMEADIIAKRSAPKEQSEKESKPPAEPKPRAPKPPSEVGGRGAAMEDELVGAAKEKDFSRFESEMNRRKFAKSN